MKKFKKKYLSEDDIINKYFQILNFNKPESFNFNNDGALLLQKKNKDIVVTNDTIIESVDFFKYDAPESIAQKIITCNLSDLSSMGADPYTYTLSLSLPNRTSTEWITKFTKKLLNLQKKYNFFLIGGDIGKSNKIQISANFFGYIKKNLIIPRQYPNLNDDIWVTGKIGDSFIGLLLKKNKIDIDKSLHNYFIKEYLYPKPCMIGSKINILTSSGIDISDGFFGDLSKLLNDRLGANISSLKIPFSNQSKILIKNKTIDPIKLLYGGDDYEIIFTSSAKNENKIIKIANKIKIKVTKVGKIIDKKGIFIDEKKLNNTYGSYQYFF